MTKFSEIVSWGLNVTTSRIVEGMRLAVPNIAPLDMIRKLKTGFRFYGGNGHSNGDRVESRLVHSNRRSVNFRQKIAHQPAEDNQR
jgi:hypothetical protein